jgi:hypothetical protein
MEEAALFSKKHDKKNNVVTIIGIIAAILIIAAGAGCLIFFGKTQQGKIVIPYIAHQKPRVDPHLPSAVPIADKLDEVIFDGLFNVSANASGITYEDGLGELIGVDENGVVTIRLKPKKKWHDSYTATLKKEKVTLTPAQEIDFTARDLAFTLRRIQRLGSLSPDYILVAQAIADLSFQGPDADGTIRFQFKGDRDWKEGDIKEILSFKILPASASPNAASYSDGTGPYKLAGEFEDNILFEKNPDGRANIPKIVLRPFVDNSTYMTELRNKNINVLLSTPFGAISPILEDSVRYFCRSSISTTFFGMFFNTQRLSLEQRIALRQLVNNSDIMNRFFKRGTAQQRHIVDYRGGKDNYDEYLNNSVFPSTSYYIEEKIVSPQTTDSAVDLSVLPDTVHIATCLNYENREELADLIEILNDPTLCNGRIKVSAVDNADIRNGNYDAVLFPVTGYRSNFLFDLYSIFLRQPDFATYRINLQTHTDATGRVVADDACFSADRNFFRLNLTDEAADAVAIRKFLESINGFMSSSEIGDKQAYAQYVDSQEHELALGAWLFSLPSLAYLSRQFDESTVDMYGAASQLSTVEKWQEKKKR